MHEAMTTLAVQGKPLEDADLRLLMRIKASHQSAEGECVV